MTWTPRRCAHPGCTFWIPKPARAGRPPMRCPEHTLRDKAMRHSTYQRAAYAMGVELAALRKRVEMLEKEAAE